MTYTQEHIDGMQTEINALKELNRLLEIQVKPTERDSLMELITIKGQNAVSVSSVFNHFNLDAPTSSEITAHIEAVKLRNSESLTNSNVELKEDCQTMYRCKLNESKAYLQGKETGRLIRVDNRQLVSNLLAE